MKSIRLYEPWFFLFFGVFHLHRIWGLVDRKSYAAFWLIVLEKKGAIYYILMGILVGLCLSGITTFIKNIHNNYWWRWIYLVGGGYALFDLLAIATGLKFWHELLLAMFDVEAGYWNIVWGMFILIGGASFVLGIALLKRCMVSYR